MMNQEIIPAAKIFNGRITIENSETGEHRTFSIKTQKADAKFAPGKRILALLSGPDNTRDYQGFAFVDDSGVHVWAKYKGTTKPTAYDWYADMVSVLVGGFPSRYGKHYEGYEVHVAGRCLKCNRALTTPESIKSGIGPVCASGGWD